MASDVGVDERVLLAWPDVGMSSARTILSWAERSASSRDGAAAR